MNKISLFTIRVTLVNAGTLNAPPVVFASALSHSCIPCRANVTLTKSTAVAVFLWGQSPTALI